MRTKNINEYCKDLAECWKNERPGERLGSIISDTVWNKWKVRNGLSEKDCPGVLEFLYQVEDDDLLEMVKEHIRTREEFK